MAPALTVAVVSWNTRELLGRCLAALEPAAAEGLAEVWVVDNGSADGSPELVRERFGWTRLEARSDNLGFGRAVNLVAERTKTPWVAAANADVEVSTGALRALLAAGERHPRAGVLAPRLALPDGAIQHTVHPFPTLPVAVAVASGAGRAVPGLGAALCLEGRWDPFRSRDVDWAHGALLAVRREAWDEVGGFDASQWLYAEDLDLCWRMARAGWTTRYVAEAEARHHVSAATSQAFGDGRLERSQASAYAWMVRRRGLARTRAYAAVNLAGAGVRAAALTPAARLRPSRFGAPRDLARRWARAHRAALR
jgi:GT2 family glycosyltransferase